MLASQSYIDSRLAELQPVLRSTAKNLLRHLADDPIARARGTFSDLETLSGRIVDALAVEVMNPALPQEADQLAGQPPPPCPLCSRPTRRREPRRRHVQTDHGAVPWDEPECVCGSCRKAFFPSDRATET
jgi:hypothetical protein